MGSEEALPISSVIERRYHPKLLRRLGPQAPSFPLFTEKGRWVPNPVERWTEGFWPGLYWLAWSQTGDPALRAAAEACLPPIAPRFERANANYDLGFLYSYSFALGYRLTGNEGYRATALAAARRLCDFFDEAAQVITFFYPERVARFGSARVTTKIDVMMNLSLLWWAYEVSGERRFHEVATRHARRSLECLLREDGSVWEMADFAPDSGELLLCDTQEGIAGSCWARAQAWAIYGFLQAGHFTGDQAFYQVAGRALLFWRAHLPDDGVPIWDLTAPAGQRQVRDASAAAIVTAALVKARGWGIDLPEANALLTKTLTGLLARLADDDEDGVLNGGCAYFRKQEGLTGATVWGDYYFLEALTGLARARGG